MNNLKRMKSQIISKIEQMDCSEFEIFTDELVESKIKFDSDSLFTCDKCRETYGDCKSEHKDDCSTELCSARFKKYCMKRCN